MDYERALQTEATAQRETLWNHLDCRGMRDFIRREKYKDYFDL